MEWMEIESIAGCLQGILAPLEHATPYLDTFDHANYIVSIFILDSSKVLWQAYQTNRLPGFLSGVSSGLIMVRQTSYSLLCTHHHRNCDSHNAMGHNSFSRNSAHNPVRYKDLILYHTCHKHQPYFTRNLTRPGIEPGKTNL